MSIVENGNLPAFHWWFDDTKVKVWQFFFFCISAFSIVIIHSDVETLCNLIGESQNRTAEKRSTVVSADTIGK